MEKFLYYERINWKVRNKFISGNNGRSIIRIQLFQLSEKSENFTQMKMIRMEKCTKERYFLINKWNRILYGIHTNPNYRLTINSINIAVSPQTLNIIKHREKNSKLCNFCRQFVTCSLYCQLENRPRCRSKKEKHNSLFISAVKRVQLMQTTKINSIQWVTDREKSFHKFY